MPGCRLGDLAFVIKDSYPENIGAVVRVAEARAPCPECGGIQWLIVTNGRRLIGHIHLIPGAVTAIAQADRLIAHDASLQPIRPPEKIETVKTDEKKPVTA